MEQQDAAAAAAIDQHTFSMPWREQDFIDSLLLENTVFLVAEEDVANSTEDHAMILIGYIGMYRSFEEGEITNVAVSEPFRGQGIGKKLVRAMQEEAEKSGIDRIVLEVRVSNIYAIRVYEEQGFSSVGIRKGFYEKPKEDADIMVWEK